eukprot:3613965-Pyramimonas_sp.AAC.1
MQLVVQRRDVRRQLERPRGPRCLAALELGWLRQQLRVDDAPLPTILAPRWRAQLAAAAPPAAVSC